MTSLIEELEARVQAQASARNDEVLSLLISRLAEKTKALVEAEQACARQYDQLHFKLKHYIDLKLRLRRLEKVANSEYTGSSAGYMTGLGSGLWDTINTLREAVKTARKDYYIERRKQEPEHPRGCYCRGCQLLLGARVPNGGRIQGWSARERRAIKKHEQLNARLERDYGQLPRGLSAIINNTSELYQGFRRGWRDPVICRAHDKPDCEECWEWKRASQGLDRSSIHNLQL